MDAGSKNWMLEVMLDQEEDADAKRLDAQIKQQYY